MAKFTEYINNNPEYFDYLKSKVEGNVSVQELAEEEIKALEEQNLEETEFIKEVEEQLDIQ